MTGRFICKRLLDAPWVVAGAGVLFVVAVLLALAAPAGAGDGAWGALRRPLHLPKLASGAACPVSRVDARVRWERINIFGGTGIGRGPVYPGLGSRGGLLYATPDEQYGGRWFGEKVFWYVLPSYRGPVLIRGHRLDGPQSVGFNGAKLPASELRIGPNETVSWSGQPAGSRGVASGVRVLTAGCYGFQIDGTSFSRTVVFVADVAR